MNAAGKNKRGKKDVLAVTIGDPEGIGPEIVRKSLEQFFPDTSVVVVGSIDYYPKENIQIISDLDQINGRGVHFFDIPVHSIQSDPSFEYVSQSVKWALEKKIGALVTAPVSKEKWLKAGVQYKGHTGMLAETAGVKNHAMFFWSDTLKVALFTVHVPLKEIFQSIKKEKIIPFIRFIEQELCKLFKRRFKILVAGLNPHAGENGYLGTEEIEVITPAIKALKNEMDIEGPYPPDIVFIKARETENSVVISWYHDQGLIPFKLLNIHDGVNMTLGLPYIRTSPDHGTAYDIAGKGIANPSSMIQSIKLAERLVKR